MKKKEKIAIYLVIGFIVVMCVSLALANWHSWETRRNTVKVQFGTFEYESFYYGGLSEWYVMTATALDGTEPFTRTKVYVTHEEEVPSNFTVITINDETEYNRWVDWQNKTAFWTYTYDLIGGRHTVNVEEISHESIRR